MAIIHTSGATERLRATLLSLWLVTAALLSAAPVYALTEISDEDLGSVDGAGMVFAWTDFRFLMNPTSYLEQQGTNSMNTCTATGSGSGNQNCWRRGDLRWYGMGVSAVGTTVGQAVGAGPWNTTWTTASGNMTQCADSGFNGLGCPRGGPIAYFAPHDNPYVLRVMDYAGDASAATAIGNGVVTYQGNNAVADWSNGAGTGSKQTVLEWLAPTSQDNYRFSFWGELEVGRNGTGSGLLKSQTIIQGNAAGSVLRFFKFTQTSTSPGMASAYNPLLGAAGCVDGANSANATASASGWGCAGVNGTGSAYNNRTLGIQYISHLRGDFRFSVAQAGTTSDALGVPVGFNGKEGVYFRGADVYLPIGQPFYQALTLNVPRSTTTNAPVTDGNLVLEMPLLPNRTSVYSRFYALTDYTNNSSNPQAPNGWDDGYATARSAYLYNLPVTGGATPAYMPARTAATITNYTAPDAGYARTHGYARWGDWSVCQGVGCRLPLTANTAAQALAGTGRNAWNSSGDGVFFVGTTAYNAYAYKAVAKDVRSNTNTYTDLDYYASFANCTPSSSTAYSSCGYGGAYLGSAAQSLTITAKPTSFLPAENIFLTQDGTTPGTSCIISGCGAVISVPANTALNLGDARVEGIQLNYLRFTSYGANN